MTDVVITASVTSKTTVTLSSSQTGLVAPDTFLVKNGDTVEWRFQGATGAGLGGLKARIKFFKFPKQEERPLLVGGSTLDEAASGVIRAARVNEQAFNGEYRYRVQLVSPNGAITELECSWASSVGGPPTPTGMGGGKRGGGPGGP
jgi:hypothetical protein